MSNKIDEFITLLDANGFSFKRDNGKHEIWSDGVENFALPTGKVTSSRMHDYLRSELRKKVQRQKREFIDWEDLNKKEGKMFNPPKIKLDIVDQGEWKTLDDDALHFCTEATKEKKNQSWMAESLMSLGYRGKKGGRITQVDVSNFMISHGLKKFERKHGNVELVKEKPNQAAKAIPPANPYIPPAPEKIPDIEFKKKAEPEAFKSDLLDDVREILSAGISERLKDKLLRNLLK